MPQGTPRGRGYWREHHRNRRRRSRRVHVPGAALSDHGDRRAGILALRHGAADDVDHPAADAGRAVGDPGRDRLGDDVQHPRHRRGDAYDRLAGVALRHEARGGLLDRPVHAVDAAMRHVAVARDAGAVAHPAGRHGGADRAAVAVDPVQHVSAAAAHDGDVGIRDGGRRRAGVRSGHRRLSRRDLQLALVVLHAGADRRLRHHRHELDAAAGQQSHQAALRLDRLHRARGGARRRATGAGARRAAGLVRIRRRS